MAFGFLGNVAAKIIGQFDIFRKYKGIKPAQTSAATITSNSKELTMKLEDLEVLKIQLIKQIKNYKNNFNKFSAMKAPAPGSKKKDTKIYNGLYHQKRKELLSLINLIVNTTERISKEFNESIKLLKNITFDSQNILFDLEKTLNRFFDYYLDIYYKFKNKKKNMSTLKEYADKINEIKEDLKSKLRVLWEASKAQERRVANIYSIEEWSILGNNFILRKIKMSAIEIGTLILKIHNLKSNDIKIIEEESKKIIKDSEILQKDVKIILNRAYSLFKKIRDSEISPLDEMTKKKLLNILNKSSKKYDSTVSKITTQSKRLWLDVKIRANPIEVQKIVQMPQKEIKRAA